MSFIGLVEIPVETAFVGVPFNLLILLLLQQFHLAVQPNQRAAFPP